MYSILDYYIPPRNGHYVLVSFRFSKVMMLANGPQIYYSIPYACGENVFMRVLLVFHCTYDCILYRFRDIA